MHVLILPSCLLYSSLATNSNQLGGYYLGKTNSYHELGQLIPFIFNI